MAALTADSLHAGVVGILRAIPNITVYDGNVDDKPPADQYGFVLPYLVVWASPGLAPAHPLSAGASFGMDWSVQITCAGGSQERVLQGLALARTALDCARPASGSGPLIEQPGSPMLLDRDVIPPRFFAALRYRCYTA